MFTSYLSRVLRLLILALAALRISQGVQAQSVSVYAVRVSAVAQTDPPAIVMSWPVDSSAASYTLYRRLSGDTSWDAGIELGANATGYVETNVAVGDAVEYHIYKGGLADGNGYIRAGIELPLVESRGKVILVVDNRFATGLSNELGRLQDDLAGDGWTVLRHDVPAMAVDPAETNSNAWVARSNELASVKALILSDYNADPLAVKSVFLFGHVPVPYSGDIYPDQHTGHRGAWPADVFYGEMNGQWTDSTVNRTSPGDPRNRNVPGDGKFDQSLIPSDVELQVGRVDFANLPAFPVSETELLRQYLNKDHAFRHKLFTAERRGLIDDHLGMSTSEALAANGWRDFAAFFGASNTMEGDWSSTLASQSYLWAYGCGAGTYTSCSGVATTAQLAGSDPRVVFSMLFGSYFGDWDSQNNLLRAAIATTNYTLTCAWVGRPFWYHHHMALGETIGFSTRLSQNNDGFQGYWGVGMNRMVHIALMGDPTLRLHVVGSPANLAAAADPGGVKLTWNPSSDTVLGYHVYRSTNAAGPFTRLTASLITDTNYTDAEVGTNVYMVRAVKLEVSGSGSYYNASQGVFRNFEPSANILPVAGADTIERDPTNGTKVAVATLLSNDTDADGDLISFLGVSATSANGGVVVSNSGWVIYTPAVGWTNMDTFTYTISDNRGAPVVGAVTVNVRLNNGPAPTLTITHESGNTYRVDGNGVPNRLYRVQFADDLTAPDWQALSSVTADADGRFETVDVAGTPRRFYRAVYP